MMRRENNYFLIWTCLCCAAFEHLHFPDSEMIYLPSRALKAMDLMIHLAMHVLYRSIVLKIFRFHKHFSGICL